MKLLNSILLLLLLPVANACASNPFESEPIAKDVAEEIDRRTDKYAAMTRFFENLNDSGRFELILLDPISEYESAAERGNWLAESSVTNTQEVLELKNALLSFFNAEGTAAFCYYPIHELRGYNAKGTEVIRLTICWGCSQAIAQSGDYKFGWQIGDADALEQLFMSRIPVPDEYKDLKEIAKRKAKAPTP